MITNVMADILLLFAYGLKNTCLFGLSFFQSFDILQLQFHFIDMTVTLGDQHPETCNLDFYLFRIKDCFSLKKKSLVL